MHLPCPRTKKRPPPLLACPPFVPEQSFPDTLTATEWAWQVQKPVRHDPCPQAVQGHRGEPSNKGLTHSQVVCSFVRGGGISCMGEPG